ncbi:MAG: hypothetical protein A2X08_05260 [Bacteroidetes bacterium GWA2_32_17]|nr:MAG: hypothetical protein A2X08_05260 [Bacteroidetes bacterium GWA2_32_17]
MKSIFDIHKRLGINLENGLFIIKNTHISSNTKFLDLYDGDELNYKSNFKVEYTLKKLNPHSFFLFNNEPLLLFFDYAKQIDKETLEKLSRDVWNFNKSALVFVNTPNELNIYNGFHYKKSGLLQVLETIKTIKDEQKLDNYSYWKIVNSELWYAKDEVFKKNTRVDTKLLENIKIAREILINKVENPLIDKHANRIIGRLIFIRYLIDRKVNFDYIGEGKELLTKEELPKLILQKDNLFNFFEYLLEKFKGDILPLNGERDVVQTSHLAILSNLFKGDDIKTHQGSLFNVFDFDFIPIELISNIYETFLGKKQDTDKAFYTPPFLVDYVLSQTVKPFISEQIKPNKISCKTVDFTCGSGIFLCETLRTIISRYIELANPDKSSKKFKEKIKQLLTENIYGNDVNQEAIEIAKFSLFITLLDYFENPKDIEGFEFPSISGNFYDRDVFSDELNDIFGNKKLIEPDFIIGNPPWGKLEKSSRYLEYCIERAKKETKEKKELLVSENKNLGDFKPVKIEISNKEFAQAFLLRLSDFSATKTVCHIIITSKLLYNLQAVNYRNYFLNNFLINDVLEISSVRHQIFTNAVGPAAIIKYKYAFGGNTKENIIDYVSLKPNPYFAIFKSILIEKYDYKEIIQNELIENDWLWKVLVYGHILDYKFIKRLRDKKEFPLNFEDIFTKPKKNRLKTDLIWGSEGAQVGNKKNSAKHLLNKLYIQTNSRITKRESDLQRFYINFNYNSVWTEKKVERACNPEIFKSPFLAMKSGLTQDFKFVASISNINAVFTKSIYAIKSYNENSILRNLLGLINSELLSYFILQTGSSTGVEREQIFDSELYTFPLILINTINGKVNNLIKLKRLIEIHKYSFPVSNIKINEYQQLFNKKEVELNQYIYELYNLSKTELDLIDYTQKITIPILQAKNKPFKNIRDDINLYRPYKKVEENEITDYINIFKEHFSTFHNGGEKGYINTRIFQSENILAIEFYIEKKQHKDKRINESNNNELEILASLGFQKISNELFIQKDVKILKSKSFSVLKLNQYKYWHKAIARFDAIEFTEAMLKSQLTSK